MTDLGQVQQRLDTGSEQLIVALDVESADEARTVVNDLASLDVSFKVGLRLFTSAGPMFVRELVEKGHRIFLDLKYHDIPNTVAQAGIEAARLGVWMFNIHALGGSEMMKRTAEEVGSFCVRHNLELPKIIAVTTLTSSDASTLAEVGLKGSTSDHVVRLAQLAEASGMAGVVASPLEVQAIRKMTHDRFALVTPGVRPLFATNDDQKRVTTPSEAISMGTDFIVVGRPILSATDRAEAASNIVREIASAKALNRNSDVEI